MRSHRRDAFGAAVIGAALAWGAVIRFKGRRTAPRPPVPAGASLALLAPLGVLWMAAGIIDSLTGAIGWTVGPIWDQVKKLVNGVVGWVSDWVGHVVDWASAAFDAIDRGLRAVTDFANSLVSWARNLVTTTFDNLVTWVTNGINAARNLATGLVNRVTDWATTELNRLWSYASGIFDWVNRNIWEPLWSKIEGAVSWVQNNVIPWVANGLRVLRDDVGKGLDWVLDQVPRPLRHWLDWAGPILEAAGRAVGWLAWFALHPVDWFVKLWHAIGDLSPETISGMVARAMRDDAGHIEAELVRWFE